MSVRHIDTVIAISPQFDRIAWRIGRFGSDFAFPNPSDRFYHEHFVRMLDNGNLLLFDNGSGRPPAEGGQYTRALELGLDWNSMTATVCFLDDPFRTATIGQRAYLILFSISSNPLSSSLPTWTAAKTPRQLP
jgi:hypothetical protein